MKSSSHTRPYWHVDAKWICGIVFFLSMAVCLLFYSFAQLTNAKNGPTIAALAIGAVFIRGDEQQIRADAKAKIAAEGDIHPIPNFPSVVVTAKDLDLSSTDLKIKIFKPLAESMYSDGIEATAAKYTKTPEEQKKFVNEAFIFRLFTKKVHQTLQRLFTISLVFAVFFLLGVIGFSARWGRLANPGFLLVLVSLPGALVAAIITHPPKNVTNGAAFGFLPHDLGSQIGDALNHSYSRATLFGLILLAVAVVGRLATVFIKKPSPTSPSADVKKSEQKPGL